VVKRLTNTGKRTVSVATPKSLFLNEGCTLLTLQNRHLEKPDTNSGNKLGEHGTKTRWRGEATIHYLYEENVAMGS
jgi:hypothetical protein